MNIGQMMRGLLGEATSGEARTMELKAGQIVRGVVMQSLDNNEAIVAINGVHVRAKLELPLQQGQSAMLQVQPDSNGAVVLKAVDLTTSGLLDDTFRDYAKQLGLPDQKWALALIRSLRQEGFPFNRSTAAAFKQAASVMPKGADVEQWMTAAATAFKRGMPMTAATIGSLQQVMFGKPAHELLHQLQQQLTGLASPATAADNDALPPAAARVLALLQQGNSLLEEALPPRDMGAGSAERSKAAAADSQAAGRGAANPTLDGDETQSTGINARSAQADQHGQTGAGIVRQGQASTPTNWLGQMMKWMGVDHELQLAKAATEAAPQGASGQQASGTGENAASHASGRSQTPGEALGGARTGDPAAPMQSARQQGAIASPSPSGTTLRQDSAGANAQGTASAQEGPELQAAGSRTDQSGMAAAARSGGVLAGDATQNNERALPAPGPSPVNAAGGGATTESLKSALMSLATGADTPPHVKETAQQLIHQITGQQLLLAPERNNSVFTHVTMFIPLKDASGEQTASVQIQTRRGRRGELDADNCRLLFNLSMRSLGDLLVDVQITDKIVSLQLWNDHPAIADLTESSRDQLAARLSEMGYQLLSMRTKPLPSSEAEDNAAAPSAAAAAAGKPSPSPNAAWLTAARYKGVDYRA